MKKNFIYVSLFLILSISVLSSCGNSSDSEEDLNNEIENIYEETQEDLNNQIEDTEDDLEAYLDTENSEDIETSESGDCDEFLEEYESFVDEYISILKKYKSNPSDMSIMSDYTRMASDASQWSSKTPDCSDVAFVSKLTSIQMKMANAASGM